MKIVAFPDQRPGNRQAEKTSLDEIEVLGEKA
jgi:hypothetical protein